MSKTYYFLEKILSTMIAFILLELRGVTVWKGKPFSHRWPFNLHFTRLFFWLSNLIGCNAEVRARLINDWRLLKSPRQYSHSWIILSIAIHHFSTLVWYLIYQIQLLALVRRPNSVGFVFRMLGKIRNPLAAALLSNGGDPTTVALSIGCLRVRSWSSAGIPQQHPAKRLVVSGRAGGSKEKNTSVSLSSNFWCGWEKQSDRKTVKWQMFQLMYVFKGRNCFHCPSFSHRPLVPGSILQVCLGLW